MKTRNIVAIAIIIFVIAGATVLMLFLKKTTISPQSNQKTNSSADNINDDTVQLYRNDKYGFKINYPTDWFLKEHGNQVFFDFKEVPVIIIDSETPLTTITLSMEEKKDLITSIGRIINTLRLSDFQEVDIVVGGVKGKRISGMVRGESYIRGSYYDTVFFERENVLFQLSYVFNDKTYLPIYINMYKSLDFK